MSLMLKAIETYDAMEHLAGVPVAGKQTLAPIGHMLVNAAIEVTVDRDGNFVGARDFKEKVIIPCTEDSASRTSAVEPHPLCDNIGYISGQNKAKHGAYIAQLDEWIASGCSNKKVLAVSAYVKKKSVLNDLKHAGLENVKDDSMIIWRVAGLGELSGLVCEDLSLQREYAQYYLSIDSDARTDYCMVTGKAERTTSKHLKGVVAFNGNAKIISANDSTNFTYRGRLLDDIEASSVGYIASQKAHNALKWVVANEGIPLGSRTCVCVCWNPDGITIPKIDDPFALEEEQKPTPSEYKKALKEKVLGYKALLPDNEGVVVAMFDAATTGRLSVTYYNELLGSDFVDRLAAWDDGTSFPSSFYGVRPPRLRNFVDYAFGTYRSDYDYFATDDKIFRQHMQRMIIARVENGKIPADIVRGLVRNASRLSVYKGKKSERLRDDLLHTTCSAIKKRYTDIYKEEWPMALERDKKDRSYQYGRLLSVLEKMENDTYSSNETKRETNAIRSQHMFIQRPQTGFAWIMDKLQQSYIKKLSESSRVYYDKLIQEIVEVLSEIDEDANKPLTETYLMGYYLQKKELYKKKSENEVFADENTENNDVQ